MLGNFIKSVFALATVGLATVGGLTFVPDETWETFPEALAPARTLLAEYGVAPSKYRSAQSRVDIARADAPYERESAPSDARRGSGVTNSVYLEKTGSGAFDAEDLDRPEEPSRFDMPRGGVRQDTIPKKVERRPIRDYERDSEPDVPRFPLDQDEPPVPSKESLDRELVDPDVISREEPPTPREPEYPDPVVPEPPAEPNPLADVPPLTPAVLPNEFSDPITTPAPAPAPIADPIPAPAPAPIADPIPTPAPAPIAEPTPAPAPTVDAIPAPVADPLAGSANTLDPAPAPQGYLAPDPAAPAQTDPLARSQTPAETNVQSFDDYLKSQSALERARQTGPNPPAAEETFPVGQTSATAQIPLQTAGLPAFREAVAQLQQPHDDAQTRAIFATLNAIQQSSGANMAAEDVKTLNRSLDFLAFETFYNSKNFILEPPRQVGQNETLASIAREYDVTPELIAAINGLNPSQDTFLTPGSTLKVVRGPVTAELSVSKKELVLRFNNYYAGRFQFGIPRAAIMTRGTFTVESKIEKPSCDAVDVNGDKLTIQGGDPNNPLGACWIGLRGGPGLQGTNRGELVGTVVEENGGVVFSNEEISQLNIILPIGAAVTFVD
ncbi:MAG: LysM peptidoglycan-binding domain-containing protein [Thermoguttaceae bacterium]|nr:LysM peptidoglycan-binding domain-containing protein [Thermoguttaceae bacterium]